MKLMKTIDVVVWTLLAVGGLNWGLVGLFGFNLVAAIFGEMSMISRLVYTLVGLSAVYDVVGVKAIWKRWEMHFENLAHT